MKEITINKVKYILRNVLRNFFVYEEIKGTPFSFGKLIDEYLLFYCTLLANNDTFYMPFDKFIEYCDENPIIFSEYKNFVVSEIRKQAQLSKKIDGSKKKRIR